MSNDGRYSIVVLRQKILLKERDIKNNPYHKQKKMWESQVEDMKKAIVLIESAPKKVSEAEMEEIKDDLALVIKGFFIRWREQFPEEDKDVDELPLKNAKNMVSFLIKKYKEYESLKRS